MKNRWKTKAIKESYPNGVKSGLRNHIFVSRVTFLLLRFKYEVNTECEMYNASFLGCANACNYLDAGRGVTMLPDYLMPESFLLKK